MDNTIEINLDTQLFSNKNKKIALNPAMVYDVLILGGGPAALTAAVYCMRKGVLTGLITKNVGGQMLDTESVQNYMGFKYIEGKALTDKFDEHMKQFEIGFKEGFSITALTLDNDQKVIHLEDGTTYKSKSVIIATGKSYLKINVPGEKEFLGKGVAYCTVCDAPLFKGKKVAVIGGGNSGIEAAIDLAKIAEKVTVIETSNKLKADKILIGQLNTFNNVEILLERKVTEIKGNKKVESVEIVSNGTNEKHTIDVQGIFIQIGLTPNSSFVQDILTLNKQKEIMIDCNSQTGVPGIFAAGDVTSVSYKQIIIAAGEGAKAALSACDYVLKRNK